jgi:DNA mismatch repair protein MutL
MLKLVDENQLAVQKLIFPYFFTVNSTEANVFLDHIEDFKSLGINIKEYGENTFCIDEAPVLFKDLNYKKFIDDLKSNLNQFKLDKKTLLKEFLAKTACKSAVKAGDRLSEEDIEALLADLENHKVLLCPHGRPFVYVVTKRDIEKWFKRIV